MRGKNYRESCGLPLDGSHSSPITNTELIRQKAVVYHSLQKWHGVITPIPHSLLAFWNSITAVNMSLTTLSIIQGSKLNLLHTTSKHRDTLNIIPISRLDYNRV